MQTQQSTCWDVIAGAASGEEEQRKEFARRYSAVIREYLQARWRGTPLYPELEDAVNDVYVECFRLGGALEGADSTRATGFRGFLFGVVRNVARRFEKLRARRRELQASTQNFNQVLRDSLLLELRDETTPLRRAFWAEVEDLLEEARR